MSASPFTGSADIARYLSTARSKLPIARAVEVPSGTTIIFLSGQTPSPLDPNAKPGSAAYWGDTKAQTISVLSRIKDSLEELSLDLGAVVAMTVYLVGDPAKNGNIDFDGFTSAYSRFFGTKD
jgi:enamine deaminase RidA (YjgF/YER057c/UK114 family)